MTEAEAQKLVTVLVTAYPATLGKLSELQQRETMGIYRRMLADLEYPVANAAVERLLATSKFMPTVAEIREAATLLARGAVKAGAEAWGEVQRLIARYGARRSPRVDFQLEDGIAARCIAALGWRELCLSESQVADRARFIELYDQLAGAAKQDVIVGELPAARRLRELQARGEQAIGADDAAARVLAVAGGDRP